jgi:hypothetical protein
MRITDKSAELQRLEIAKARPASTEGKQAAVPASPVARADKIQFSEEGRALAQQKLDSASGAAEADAPLSAERTAEIRTRILQGAYDSVDIVDQVARRMLERGVI